MPIAFHCWTIISACCGQVGDSVCATSICSRRRSPLSVRSLKPSASFFFRPIASSIALALATSSVAQRLAIILAGALLNNVGRDRRSRHAEAEEEYLVDLVAVDAERKCATEVEIGEPFLDFGIEAIGEIELQFGIRAIEAGIEMDLVFAARGVLQKHR